MSVEPLAALFDELPERRRRTALTHSSWTQHRADSYGRLAFLGDAVLGLSVGEEIFRRFPRSDIGRLTKVHGQAVSGRACALVALDLGVPERLRALAPEEPESIEVDQLLNSERAMASIAEAVIGACYLEHGFERTAAATVDAFGPEIERATETTLDFKSALQEHLAQRGVRVTYSVVREDGPPHDRRFEVEARVEGEAAGSGSGRSKKEAEQMAAAEALDRLDLQNLKRGQAP